MRRWIATVAAGLFILIAVPSLRAEEELRLSLAEALRIGLENNLDLVVERKNPAIAGNDVISQESAFDPGLAANATAGGSKSEPENRFVAPGRAKSYGANVSWTDRLQFGSSYAVGFGTARREGAGLFYDPSYNSGVSLNWTMPLLKGFGTEVNTADIVIAREGLEISKSQLSDRAQRTIKEIEDAYWDVLAARAGLDVARESLKLAQDLLDLNTKKVEVGTLAPIEITQAEAGVASREEGVIVAETAVWNAEDNLRRLLAIPPQDPRWNLTIVPTDAPRFDVQAVDLQASIASALERRAELDAARRQVSTRSLAERVARANLKHELNLVADMNPAGNNLKEIIPTPGDDGILGTDDDGADFVTEGWSSSVSEIPKLNNYDWSVELQYKFPIGNRAAKAAAANATLEREKAEASLLNAEQTVRVDVRTAVRNVESGAKRVKAAEASTILQRKTLDAEQKKFDNGMSTSFEVLRIQTDLSNARVAEIRAKLDYMKSLADLERAQGTLLEARGLKLE
ncbi:MAG TPA: TolC family protein [Candidatus Polarisedimenticolaceae bacterium]